MLLEKPGVESTLVLSLGGLRPSNPASILPRHLFASGPSALECEDTEEEKPTTEIRQVKTSFELEPTTAYLQAVKYGIRAAPELEKEFHMETDKDQDQDQKEKPELKLVYQRGAINWADECE